MGCRWMHSDFGMADVSSLTADIGALVGLSLTVLAPPPTPSYAWS